MPHPFFDTTRWPSSRAEAKRLLQLLAVSVSDPNGIKAFYEDTGENLPQLNTTTLGPDPLWRLVLANVAAAGLLRNLFDLIKTSFLSNNSQMQDAIKAVENAESVSRRRIINTDVLLLDRLPLRTALERIAPDDTAAKIVLVRGTQKSGKSHAYQLFDQMARENGAEPVYLSADSVSTLKEVLLGLSIPLGQFSTTTAEATHKEICLELGRMAFEKKQPVWIAMDDLGTDSDNVPLLATVIKDFFDQFCLSMSNPTMRRYFRLMLINYPPGQPARLPSQNVIPVQDFSDADIQQSHVEELLVDWRVSTGKLLTDEMVSTYAAEIMAKADAVPNDPAAPCRLQRLHDALREKLQTLQSP